jgi:hypothetical protein
MLEQQRLGCAELLFSAPLRRDGEQVFELRRRDAHAPRDSVREFCEVNRHVQGFGDCIDALTRKLTEACRTLTTDAKPMCTRATLWSCSAERDSEAEKPNTSEIPHASMADIEGCGQYSEKYPSFGAVPRQKLCGTSRVPEFAENPLAPSLFAAQHPVFRHFFVEHREFDPLFIAEAFGTRVYADIDCKVCRNNKSPRVI